jgi:hypothetical protein
MRRTIFGVNNHLLLSGTTVPTVFQFMIFLVYLYFLVLPCACVAIQCLIRDNVET